MSRWSPGYVPTSLSQSEPSFGETLADTLESVRARKRQDQVDAMNDAVNAAKMREAGIRPVAAQPETPGTRLRGLLAQIGLGGAPRATMDARVTDPQTGGALPMTPGASTGGPMGGPLDRIGGSIGGFAGGSLADALERARGGGGGGGGGLVADTPRRAPTPYGTATTTPPIIPSGSNTPSQSVILAPAGRPVMPGQFDVRTGTFSGAQSLPAQQAAVDEPAASPAAQPPAQPPAQPARPPRQYEPLSKGYEIEREDSRLAGALWQQAQEQARRAAVNRAAHEALVSRFGMAQVGAYGDGIDYAKLYENQLTAETSRAEAQGRLAQSGASLAESARHNRAMEGTAAISAQAARTRAGQQGGANKPPTDGERQAAMLIPEIVEGQRYLAQFDNVPALEKLKASGRWYSNWASSDEGQAYRQAGRQFLQNMIYLKSGKGITEAEADNLFSTYIPEPGDKEPVLARKRRAREILVQSARIGAGRAYGQVPDEFRDGGGSAAPTGGAKPGLQARGAPAGAGKPSRAERVKQLRAQGLSKEQGTAVLRQEGYDVP